MRDLIARTFAWVLSAFAPRRPARHTASYLTAPTEPAPVSPWSRPWTAPSSQEVRAIFRDERTRELPELQRERAYAAALARLGVDYDYPTMTLGSIVTRKRVAA